MKPKKKSGMLSVKNIVLRVTEVYDECKSANNEREENLPLNLQNRSL